MLLKLVVCSSMLYAVNLPEVHVHCKTFVIYGVCNMKEDVN